MALVLLCLLLLLLVSTISTAITIPDAMEVVLALNDLPSYVYNQYGLNFSDQWKKCIEDGSNECPWYRSVGKQGPCQEGEVFLYNRRVLRTNGSFEPVCQPPPCPDGYSLVLSDKKCYHDYDIRLGICSPILKPIRNLFGETFCSCQAEKAMLLGSKKKECHTLFTQGPCARGSLFVPVNDFVNFGRGQCLPSPCAQLLMGTQFMAEIRLPNGRTECFYDFSRIPSTRYSEGLFLSVDYSDVLPGVHHLQGWIAGWLSSLNVGTSEKCAVNDEGVCVLPLKKKTVDPHPLYLDDS